MFHCPIDASPLEVRTEEGHVGYHCQKCKGMWLPRNYLRSIQYERLLPYDVFSQSLTIAPKREISANCPAGCGQLADIANFDPVVSWCSKCHGVWFDKGELHGLLEQIPNTEGPYVIADEKASMQEGLLPPYHVPPETRRQYLFQSILIIGYGTLGAWLDDIYIPNKNGRGIHFHGVPMWFVYGAIVFTALNMLSIVADHFDTQNFKRNYRRFAQVTMRVALLLFAVGFVLDMFVFQSSSLFVGR